ncbi:MAG: ketose-bisphosphate aldolase [Tissierella sp.]|nr:ketose-bisphosphate aldolase [Tissierella sp.]
MYNYKDLGLVNTKEMFEKAYKESYAVPALNFVSIEQYNAIIDAVIEKKSPVILLASPNLHNQLGFEMIARLVQSGTDRLKNLGISAPVALHLDHGMTYEQCVTAIEYGFSSVMIDGSALPFEENIELTKKVVEYAHKYDVTVEGELGTLAGAEEEGDEANLNSHYTDPSMVEEFVRRTGVDSLAISIGTSHGLVKLKPNKDGSLPELRYDILEDIQNRIPGFPIVLHGASTISPKFVDMINQYGGKLKQAIGIPEEQITRAAKMSVCKINIASDGWICALAHTRRILAENPSAIDSRVFTLKIRPELVELYKDKMEIMGSANRI